VELEHTPLQPPEFPRDVRRFSPSGDENQMAEAKKPRKPRQSREKYETVLAAFDRMPLSQLLKFAQALREKDKVTAQFLAVRLQSDADGDEAAELLGE
jgi:hypothetical protein